MATLTPVMDFLPTPARPDPVPRPDPPLWRWLLFASAAAATVCSMLPWVQVRFASLFGTHMGPPGWRSSAGFTCLCSCALVAVMAAAESGSATSQRAVRPASLLLVVIATLVIALEWSQGPGNMRGVTASFTAWFYLLLACLPVLLTACTLRWLASESRPT